jgi:hypothetical protein
VGASVNVKCGPTATFDLYCQTTGPGACAFKEPNTSGCGH